MTTESPRHQAGRLTRAATLRAAALALTAGLAGCKGVVAASPAVGSPPAAASTAAAPAAASAAGPTASVAATDATRAGGVSASESSSLGQGPGSVSLSVTSPVGVSGSAPVPVACLAGLAYRASASSAVVHEDQFTFSVAIPRYRGPGSYPAVIAVTLRQASGLVTTVAGTSRIPAVITTAGGSFTIDATGTGGRTLDATLSWACGQ